MISVKSVYYSLVSCHPEATPKEIHLVINPNTLSPALPDAESALKAAKEACRQKAGRWFGSAPEGSGPISFCVYEDGKVVERHIVGRYM